MKRKDGVRVPLKKKLTPRVPLVVLEDTLLIAVMMDKVKVSFAFFSLSLSLSLYLPIDL